MKNLQDHLKDITNLLYPGIDPTQISIDEKENCLLIRKEIFTHPMIARMISYCYDNNLRLNVHAEIFTRNPVCCFIIKPIHK